LGNRRQPDLAASCAALPCMVPARPMSTPPPAGAAGPAAPPQQATSPLTIHGQYIKDLSFENPRAPQSLIEQKQPQLTLNLNIAPVDFVALYRQQLDAAGGQIPGVPTGPVGHA